MCVLCGESVMQIHWTDRKIESNGNGSAVVVGQYQRSRQRDRHHRTRVTNKILRYYGLTLEDWTGSKYVLRDKKGRTEIIHDLGALWPAAEKIVGRPLDPLDPLLIGHLLSNQRQ
ncbi:hypothetical protein [Effusibacillus consociatus]|uniref:Uncharacterized protein n=1 Tax=Effusibacillus consociatus TaxID=1117041 RepID=A0ABV9Q4P2_9BACL